MAALWTNGKTEPENACPIHGYQVQPGQRGCYKCRLMLRDEKPLWWERLVPSVLGPIGEFIRDYKLEILMVLTAAFCVFLWWMGTHPDAARGR